jgi:hypothetical protein
MTIIRKLITPPELPLAALLLYIIQSLYFTKTLKQNLVYRHNNAFKSASIGIFVADAVALQGFASSPEHIATHAPL